MKVIPYKQCVGNGTALGKALKAYVTANYKKSFQKEDMKEVEIAIDQVAAMRERAITICNAQDGDFNPETAVEVFGQYYMALIELKRRFPFRKFKSGLFSSSTPSVMVEFTWCDSLRREKQASSYEIDLEIVSILFNLGAAFSHAAAQCDRTSSNGLKQAGRYFMQASGVFLELQEMVNVQATQDITVVAAKWLSQLMYAQGCSATFENAITKKMKPKIISQLGMGVAEQFQYTIDILEENEPLQRWMSKSKKKWDVHCRYQNLCFQAASQYWFSKIEIENEEYGLEIARLREALEICNQVASLDGKIGKNRALRNLVISSRELCRRDYGKLKRIMIPSIMSSFQECMRLVLLSQNLWGKPAELDIPPWQYPAIFDRLIPNDILEKVEEFSKEANAKLQRKSQEANELTEFGLAMLASMNLPAALEAVEFSREVPPELWAKIASIQERGVMVHLNRLKDDISENSAACYNVFNDIADLLEEEFQNEKEMRQLYGVRWNRAPSEEVASEYHHHLNEARKYLQQASNADTKIDKMLKTSEDLIMQLTLSKDQIERSLPDGRSGMQSVESDAVREALDALSELFSEREEVIEAYRDQVTNRDVTNAFMEAPRHELSSVFASEMKEFELTDRQLDENLKKQDAVVEAIGSANETWVRSKKNSEQVSERERVLHEFNQVVDTFVKAEKRVLAGRKFYLDLLANHLQPLAQNVSGFVAARNAELRMLEEDLQGNRRNDRYNDDDDDDMDNGYQSPPAYF